MITRVVLVACLIGVACLAGGCSAGADRVPSPAPPSGTGGPVVVFAAASLRDPVEEAVRRFTEANPGHTISVNVGSSTALRTQIEQGARVDVFLSADEANAAALVASGLASGPPTVFTRTSLAVVVPRDDPARIRSPLDLARPGVKVIAAGDGVPLTGYAERLLTTLGSEPGYPPDFASLVRANTVTREADARAVLTKVELGEGDAAIVYTTDARRSDLVRIVALPPDANVLVSYAGVVVATAPSPDDARRFFSWLTGPDGQALFAEFGFEAGR